MSKRAEKFILFYLGDEQYALPSLSASKFIEFENLMPIPNVGKEVKGLIYHNGNIITVIDIKEILKIKTLKPIEQSTCLTFETGGHHYAILVDKGDETISAKKVFNDRKRKMFKRYFRSANKQKVYILEEDEILSKVNIYD